jgi:hypothetical protein
VALYSQMITGITDGSYVTNGVASSGKKLSGDNGYNPWSVSHTWNGVTLATVFSQPVVAFLCPSDGENRYPSGAMQATNYRMNRGDMTVMHPEQGASQGDDEHWNSVGLEKRGVFVNGYDGGYTFAGITDGLSSTLAYSEGVVGSTNRRNDVLGGISRVDGVYGQVISTSPRPIDWLLVKNPDGVTLQIPATGQPRVWVGDNTAQHAGRRWSDAHVGFTSIFTILPPNSPTINNATEATIFAPASSFHTGGVGCVSVDGSYRFVTTAVDTSSLNGAPRNDGVTATGLALGFHHLAPTLASDGFLRGNRAYTGPSPYGIWGAYGTPAHGENSGLP